MNVLLLSALAFVSADDFFEFPIFRKLTNVTIPAKDGFNGVTFKREALYANMIIDSVLYKTHLEPENGDIWIFEDESSQTDKPHAPSVENPQRLGFKKDLGMYYKGQVQLKEDLYQLVYAVINRGLAADNSRIGGLGLGPRNSPIFEFPMANGRTRYGYQNFADLVKDLWTQSDAFTINLAADPSNDKIVYGAMDLCRFTRRLKPLHRSPSTKLINAEFTIDGMKTDAALEIDDPNTYLDDEVVAAIARKLGAEWDENHNLYAISDMPQDGLVLNFNGLKIEVPPADLWVQDKQVDEKWYFTVRPVTSYSHKPKVATLGADILKSAYIVYDLGHDRAAIGKAIRNPLGTRYEVIPAEGIRESFFY